jgi:hypothetical protein
MAVKVTPLFKRGYKVDSRKTEDLLVLKMTPEI